MNLEKIDFTSLDATIFYGTNKIKGSAKTSLKLKTCEFSSDFVPLFPLNTELSVIVRSKGVDVFKIRGEAFLSTKRFVRLQPITLSLCENAEKVLEVPTKSIATCIRKHLFSTTYEQCQIVYCSAEKLELSDILLTPERSDHKIELIAGTPLFNENARIAMTFDNSGMMFGIKDKKAKYVYNISKIDDDNRKKLLHYIRKTALKEISRQWNTNASDAFSINVLK